MLHVRVGIGLAIALWSLFGLLDPWIVPEAEFGVWLIRFAIVVPALLLIFVFTFSPHYYRLAQPAASRKEALSLELERRGNEVHGWPSRPNRSAASRGPLS